MRNILINLTLTVASAFLLLLSTAGFGVSWFAFVAFIPFMFTLNRDCSHPVLFSWLFGFLYFSIGLSWMIVTFNYFGGAPLVAAFGLLMFVSISGGFLFFAPFGYVARRYSYHPLLLAMVFVALEAAKSFLFFAGVPWLNLAQSQYQNITILQFVSVFGEFGLSFMIMLINILIFKSITEPNRKFNISMTAIAIVIMLLPGLIRIINPINIDDTKTVIAYQTGYKQEVKWSREKRSVITNDLNMKLLDVYSDDIELLLLPESAYPALTLETPYIMDVLGNISFTTPILIGVDRIDRDDNNKLYNSMALIQDGNVMEIYNKRHLTPFGEYFPLQSILNPIKEFFFGPGDMFTAGTIPIVFEINDLKVAPLICYETGFSELLREPITMGANLIAMISNDSWFGDGRGKVQHLAIDALRVAEYGRAALRSTQDGISAIILPNGEIAETVTEPIPYALRYDIPIVTDRTIYSYIGNFWIVFVIPLIYYVIVRKRKKDNNTNS